MFENEGKGGMIGEKEDNIFKDKKRDKYVFHKLYIRYVEKRLVKIYMYYCR